MMRSFALFILFIALGFGGVAAPSSQTETAPAAASPGDHSLSPLQRNRKQAPSLWQDSIRAIKHGGWDLGDWIAYRRSLLVQASIRNRYFWFCISSFALNALLLYLFYASRVGEDRKLWKATAAMTDLWNWALYADATARHAIHKFNRHVEQCNRLAELEAGGKSPELQANEEIAHLQTELDSVRREKQALEEQLTEKESAFRNLAARIEDIGKRTAPGSVAEPHSIAAEARVQAQLMEKINQLSSHNQQLERELAESRLKVARLAQDRPVC